MAAATKANLAKRLRTFCTRLDRKILFTTHSLAMMQQPEDSELFHIDETKCRVSINPTSCSYAKARLFGVSVWDRYMLTEVEVLTGFIEAVIEKYCLKQKALSELTVHQDTPVE